MFASLPNTPYFRALTTTDVLDVTLTGEELLADDRVDFKKSSRQRRERIDIQDTVFYVSLEEIRRNYRPLADVFQKGDYFLNYRAGPEAIQHQFFINFSFVLRPRLFRLPARHG